MTLVTEPTPTLPVAEPTPQTPTPQTPTEPNPAGDPPKIETPKAEPLTDAALKFPEGFEKDNKIVPQFLEIANELGLTADGANKLVALQAQMAKEGSERATQAWQDMTKGWEDEVRADPVIGGTKLDESLTEVKKLLTSHGTPELLDALNTSGMGSNPHLIRLLHKVAKEMNEPGPVSGGAPSSAPLDAASIMYPNQGKA